MGGPIEPRRPGFKRATPLPKGVAQMSARSFSPRSLIVALILAVALALLPLATVLADGGSTILPH